MHTWSLKTSTLHYAHYIITCVVRPTARTSSRQGGATDYRRPARLLVGLVPDPLHLGMCRSAAFALKVRPQCGHGTRLGSGSLSKGGGNSVPSFSAFCTALPCRMASRKAELLFFHAFFLFAESRLASRIFASACFLLATYFCNSGSAPSPVLRALVESKALRFFLAAFFWQIYESAWEWHAREL